MMDKRTSVMRMNKKGVTHLIVVITVLAGLITILSALGVFNNINPKRAVASITGSGNYIERPVFKYVKCEATSGFVWTTDYEIGSTWIIKPSATNSYDVKIKIYDRPTLGQSRIRYSICSSLYNSQDNCQIYDRTVPIYDRDTIISEISNVRPSQNVLVTYEKPTLTGFKTISGASYQIGFIPYGLREYDVLSGSANQVNPNSCEISATHDSWRDRFVSTDADKINSQISISVNERTLMPEEVRWFVSGYVTSAEPSFVLTYKNKDAWCRTTGTTAEIYQINTLQVGSGTYKIASPDWSDYLGSENCCPKSTRGDEVCNDDFQWERIQGNECGAFQSCGSPNWIPHSEKQIIKYSCVDGRCDNEIKQVECANDFDCVNTNQICDLNSWTCVDADVNLKGQEIEPIPDSKASCEEEGGTWVTETSGKKSILNLIGIGEPEIIVKEYCDMGQSKWNIGKIIITFSIILVVIFLLIKFFPQIKSLIKTIAGRFGA